MTFLKIFKLVWSLIVMAVNAVSKLFHFSFLFISSRQLVPFLMSAETFKYMLKTVLAKLAPLFLTKRIRAKDVL